jgi:GT2 family glycosyltransferase
MQISVVILTWNSEQHIGSCLASVLDVFSNELESYEIFVLDNGSTDQSRQIIESFQQKYPTVIQSMYLDRNTGTTYSRNLALKQARGRYIAVLDSDIIMPMEIMHALLDILNESPKTGMVVPQLVYKNGKFQKSTDDFPTLLTKFRRYFFLKKIEQDEAHHVILKNQHVDYAISAFWLLKREVIDKVGLLDENIFYAPEDVDYCLRMWKAGYEIMYVPSYIVIHDAREISREFRLNRAVVEHIKGMFYLFWKHGYCLRKPLWVPIESP